MKVIQTKFKYKKPLIPLNLDKVEYIVVHHTASTTATPEQIHQWHLERDFSGFGYNAYIRKDGTVYIGRGDHIGAQVANKNSSTYGVCVEGNYDIEKGIPLVQLDALADYIKSILPKFKNLKGIKKHSEFQNKACPGKYFPFDNLLAMINEVEHKTGIVTATSLNIRNKPSLQGEIIGKCSKGEKITIYEEQGDWYRIGKNSWVSKLYVKL